MAGPTAVPGVDPSRVNTPEELATCLDGLRRRRSLSYEAMEKAAAKLLSRPGGSRREPLSKSTVGEVVTGKRLPTKGKLVTFLAVCEVAPADLAQWLAAWERASTADLARPAGAVRVRDAWPRLLGVHAAISVPGVADEVLPEYVPRDVDTAESGVQAKVKAAAERGGFVLLVGGSSVGKTRCAVEAVQALLPEWWLVHPAGAAEVAVLAAAPMPRTVVWLDELQRYLDGEHGLTGAVVRALLTAAHPVVIIGTLWPDWYIPYTRVPAPGGADLHAREREVLDLAAVVRISPEFSKAERGRARAAAGRDLRLRVALETAEYGLTQTLAAAPQLVARWEDAKSVDPYAWALLTAALDAARLGARAPASAEFLRAASPGYCTSVQQAEAPGNWFEQALAYATVKLHGAAAALTPAGTGMGHIVGYTVADYLIQHASRERRHARVPESAWDALLSHIRDPTEAARLADSARGRLLYRYAIPLYQRTVIAADEFAAAQLAATRLVNLLAEREDLNGVRAWADAGDELAAMLLAGLLAGRGDLDELRARADAGDPSAMRLARWLADRRDLDELRVRADAGDGLAAEKLVNLLADRRDLDELRVRADAGDGLAAEKLVNLLAERRDLDARRARAVTVVFADSEDLGELRAWADGYAPAPAQARLADLLAERGYLDELRARADVGDRFAAGRLAGLLADREDLDELRARADAADELAAMRLADLLADRGDLDGAVQVLFTSADAGHGDARRLTEFLMQQGRSEEAERLRWFGLNPDGSMACE